MNEHKSWEEKTPEERVEAAAKIKACNDRSYARMAEINRIASETLVKTTHAGYESGQYGQDYSTFGKAMCEIRKQVKESIFDVAPDYEMLAKQFARPSFDADNLAKAIEALASEQPVDYPTFYTPGWLADLAKKLGRTAAVSAADPSSASRRDGGGTEEPAVSGCPSLGPKVFPSGADGTEPADGDGMKRTSILEKMNEAMFDRLGEIRDLVQEVRHDIVVGMKTYEEDNVALLGAFTRLRQLCEFYKPDDQSELQREEARRLRKIVWKCYETKVDLAVMGKKRQGGKVYEVRVVKRQADVSDTYAQLKVNGKTVLTGSFIGGAEMARRMFTAAAQALVNHKAKRARDRRRNWAKRKAAKAAENQDLIEKELA